MSQKRLEWKVGLFVFACLLLLALLLLNFSKGLTYFKPTYTLRLKTTNVGGIKREAAVLMAGVQIGNVIDAQLAPDGKSVTILLKILDRYHVHGDAIFTIDSMGFLGDQYIAIIPGRNEAPVLTNNAEVVGREPFNLQEVARSAMGFIQRIDETARKLNDALTRVDRYVLNEETLTNLSLTIDNFRYVSERALTTMGVLDQLAQSNASPVNTTVSNLFLFSQQLNGVAGDLQHLLRTNEVDFTTAVKNIESSSVILKSLLMELQTGKGLAGSLLKDERLEVGFSQLISNLTVLSSNLNRHGLLWKPGKFESRPPSPLYPGRDPRR
jgi:phospholipid/cholesterol/gamma-HCH transport system substrate-binding protein